ncbi:MAG TPA: alpha/beta hydrolase [Solirubrobacteraceae bacterium]
MITRAFPEVPGVEVEHRFVEARGLRFHVALAGPQDAAPLLALHGWPQHWYIWRKVLPALAEHHRVVMPDLRGLGWSDAPPSGYEKEQLADDILAVLAALGLQRVKLIGHDWGAWVGFLLALREPERIERYVALNILPPWRGDVRRLRDVLSVWRVWYQVVLASPLGPRISADPRIMERAMRGDNVHPDAFSDADIAQFTAALQEPARARASSLIYRTFLLREVPELARGRYDETPLRVPTLLLFGEHDAAIGTAQVRASHRAADTLRVEFVPDSGHFIADERPDLVAQRALDWFAGAA